MKETKFTQKDFDGADMKYKGANRAEKGDYPSMSKTPLESVGGHSSEKREDFVESLEKIQVEAPLSIKIPQAEQPKDFENFISK